LRADAALSSCAGHNRSRRRSLSTQEQRLREQGSTLVVPSRARRTLSSVGVARRRGRCGPWGEKGISGNGCGPRERRSVGVERVRVKEARSGARDDDGDGWRAPGNSLCRSGTTLWSVCCRCGR
jgi:hypothetical protein